MALERFSWDPCEVYPALRTLQNNLIAAAQADHAAGMVEGLLRHARQVRDLTAQESPLNMLRKDDLEQAWKLADLYDPERCVLWHLLLAAELKDAGRWEDAQATLERLLEKELPRLPGRDFSDWPKHFAALLLPSVLEVSPEAFTALQQRILDDYGRGVLAGQLIAQGHFAAALGTGATYCAEGGG